MSSGEPPAPSDQRPAPSPARGLVVLPVAAAPEERVAVAPSVATARAPLGLLGRWTVLITTLLVGAVVILLIALLWSSGSNDPNPRSLPAASVGPLSLGSAPRR